MGDIKRETRVPVFPVRHPGTWTQNRLFNEVVFMMRLIEDRGTGELSENIFESRREQYECEVQECIESSTKYIVHCTSVEKVDPQHIGLNTMVALRDCLYLQYRLDSGKSIAFDQYTSRVEGSNRFTLESFNPHYIVGLADVRKAALDIAKHFVSQESDKHVSNMETFRGLPPSAFKNEEVDDSKKLQMLGVFEYHHHKALFECTFDETVYTIKIWQDSHNNPREGSKDPQRVMTYNELSPARGAFQQVVTDLMGYTSLSDVSLYMQQHAKPSPQ